MVFVVLFVLDAVCVNTESLIGLLQSALVPTKPAAAPVTTTAAADTKSAAPPTAATTATAAPTPAPASLSSSAPAFKLDYYDSKSLPPALHPLQSADSKTAAVSITSLVFELTGQAVKPPRLVAYDYAIAIHPLYSISGDGSVKPILLSAAAQHEQKSGAAVGVVQPFTQAAYEKAVTELKAAHLKQNEEHRTKASMSCVKKKDVCSIRRINVVFMCSFFLSFRACAVCL